MKFGVVSLFACALLASISHPVFADVSADTIERAEKSVVKIEVRGADGDSLGSGFVVSSDGVIITNSHVISGAISATAHFANGYKAEIIGTRLIDSGRDIAIAKIDGIGLPVIELASTNPRKGETVMALGSPHGLSFTATRGIVSAIRPASEMVRDLGDSSLKGTWIQVDAALSPGNSGGPLINEAGQVVGMSTLASGGSSAQNLNFGIGVQDISEAYTNSDGKPWIALRNGAAKAIHPSKGGGGGGGGGPEGGKEQLVPASAIRNYIEEVKKDLKQHTRGMAQELQRLKSELKEFKLGSTSIPVDVLIAHGEDADIIRPSRAKGIKKFYFSSDRVKTREVSRLENTIQKLTKAIEKSKGTDQNEALLAILEHGGPPLEPREAGSIGFMKEATTLGALGKKGVLIIYNDLPFLLIVNSSTGIFPGQNIEPMPVFVGGIIAPPQNASVTVNLTVLVEVPLKKFKEQMSVAAEMDAAAKAEPNSSTNSSTKSEVDEFLNGSETKPKNNVDGMREWNDRTGKFSVQAKLISSDEKEVTLKRADGKLVKIPRSKLSDADQRYLDQK